MSDNLWQTRAATEQQLTLRDPAGWFLAQVQEDGCVDLYRYFEAPQGENPESDEECCYLHICDVQELIERLQQLKTLAIQHFNKDGTSEFWQEDA